MEVMEIHIAPSVPDAFFCPLSGEPAVDEHGFLAVSCVASIPPLAFHHTMIGCPHLESYWAGVLENANIDVLHKNVTGESIQGFLEAHEGSENQNLIGFRVETTILPPRVLRRSQSPSTDCPVFTSLTSGVAFRRTSRVEFER